MRHPLIFIAAISTIFQTVHGASIYSSTGYVTFADAPGYPIVSSGLGLPSFGASAYQSRGGSFTINGDLGEDIYSISLLFIDDPYEEILLGTKGEPYGGGTAENDVVPGPSSFEQFTFSWYSPYVTPPSYGYTREFQITGTSHILVSSSLGNYSLGSYGYSYIGIVPEANSFLIAGSLMTAAMFKRRRSYL